MRDTTQELWRTEFDKQYTRGLLRVLYKQTAALVRRYQQRTSRRGADLDTMDRVNTSIMKLLDGSRVWDPARVDLGNFLLGVVASDLSAELRRVKRFPEVSLDEPAPELEDDYTGEPVTDAREGTDMEPGPVRYTCKGHETLDRAWIVAVPHLREGATAANDEDVLALLAAYDDGVYQKCDVMHRLHWDRTRYQRVYRRLLTIAKKADEDVRDLIERALAN